MVKINWSSKETLWQVVPIGLVVVSRLANAVGLRGQTGFSWWEVVSGNLLLVAGWLAGWKLLELDRMLCVLMRDPQNPEIFAIRNQLAAGHMKEAWVLSRQVSVKGDRMPLANMLTAIVLAGMGLWVVTSSGSPLASGLVMGLSFGLFSRAAVVADYENWYWVFARKFTLAEHKGFVIAWGIVLAVSGMILANG